jgi:hypothetical protein
LHPQIKRVRGIGKRRKVGEKNSNGALLIFPVDFLRINKT